MRAVPRVQGGALPSAGESLLLFTIVLPAGEEAEHVPGATRSMPGSSPTNVISSQDDMAPRDCALNASADDSNKSSFEVNHRSEYLQHCS